MRATPLSCSGTKLDFLAGTEEFAVAGMRLAAERRGVGRSLPVGTSVRSMAACWTYPCFMVTTARPCQAGLEEAEPGGGRRRTARGLDLVRLNSAVDGLGVGARGRQGW
jgi:hypothetical protein